MVFLFSSITIRGVAITTSSQLDLNGTHVGWRGSVEDWTPRSRPKGCCADIRDGSERLGEIQSSRPPESDAQLGPDGGQQVGHIHSWPKSISRQVCYDSQCGSGVIQQKERM